MRDIKLTLSTELGVRAPSIEDEAAWIRRSGQMGYPLNSVPRESGIGQRVYFIRAGQLVARATIVAFDRPGKAGKSFGGVSKPAAPAGVRVSDIEVLPARKRIACKGFQGFRYLTDSELTELPKPFP
jgi:hypothetical protein